jgi:hypothetical protein
MLVPARLCGTRRNPRAARAQDLLDHAADGRDQQPLDRTTDGRADFGAIDPIGGGEMRN